MGQEWEIHHIDRKVADAPPGLIVLEWKLNRSPEPEWTKYFITGPGQKSGTGEFLSRVPEVFGSKIRFAVREEDLENAVTRVENAIDGANRMFDTYVMSRRRQDAAKRQAEETARERRLLEARQRLDRLEH